MRFLIFFLFSITFMQAQYSISGQVYTSAKKAATAVKVYSSSRAKITQNQNSYKVTGLKPGERYTLSFYLYGYKVEKKEFILKDKDIIQDVVLTPLAVDLDEVVVKKVKKNVFGLNKLSDVQHTAIYAGKKTELITLKNTLANTATNNARQIYAKVAGLNIWESDGAGLQLGIGGRGLSPDRTANFNVRQNGYDISADPLGYPESYYTPITQALEQIEIVRGAASLQYGTQFGGLLNFKLKKPEAKPFALSTSQSIGSFGLLNHFTRVSGTTKKWKYNAYGAIKQMDGYRANSNLRQYNGHIGVYYTPLQSTTIGLEFTHMQYLAKQAGGLSDAMFYKDPKQSNRARNWFAVHWNLLALHLDHKFSDKTKVNMRFSGLIADRKSVGYRSYRPETIDPYYTGASAERELIVGKFKNFSIESRFLHRYQLSDKNATLLVGARYFQGKNTSRQGLGSAGKDADFSFINLDTYKTQTFTDEVTVNASSYTYPNKNIAFFAENIFSVTDKFQVTPGFRIEYIDTKAQGNYRILRSNQAGDITLDTTTDEKTGLYRDFVLSGIGFSYKPVKGVELYANASQNYRSVTFSDIRITTPNALVDPDIADEKGYSLDLGIRGAYKNKLQYDITGFYMHYNNRLGDILAPDPNNGILKRIRTNVGRAAIVGVESLLQCNVLATLGVPSKHKLSVFTNIAWIQAQYTKQFYANSFTQIQGNRVEFVPDLNVKTGLSYGYKDFSAALQYTHMGSQFTDATNAQANGGLGTIGEIPAYQIADFSIGYTFSKAWKVDTGVNNFLNASYFTRRATGYPGPGIIPSDPRTWYFTLQYSL